MALLTSGGLGWERESIAKQKGKTWGRDGLLEKSLAWDSPRSPCALSS